MATISGSSSSLTQHLVNGVIGGAVGGVAFGVMMGMQGMLPMVGMLIGQDNAVVGFVVHMLISAFIGATFGVIASRVGGGKLPTTLIVGTLYGVVWWVLGALILMPLMLGMNAMVLQVGQMQINSLIGHAIFGVLMGGVYHVASSRNA
ncbi:MAG: DUF1440 domain-containing protein [Anaerolineae bacterium]|jgi:uncharacterized membrane protein YagU involved in acid resistance|nr:DUF1440 domain-containing protein [Anaerolineae bacterium]